MLREQLLTEADSVERTARLHLDNMRMESAFLQFLKPQDIPDEYRRKMTRARWLRLLVEMNLYVREPSTVLSSEALHKLFVALGKAGVITDTITDDDEDA